MHLQAQRGVTLLELMIAVAIVGILAAIALPSYREHVLRGNRAEGQALLTTAAAQQERYRAQNNTYATSVTELYGGPKQSETQKYSLSISNGAGGYTLTATQLFGDTDCGNLTLDGTGERGAGGSKDVTYCWR